MKTPAQIRAQKNFLLRNPTYHRDRYSKNVEDYKARSKAYYAKNPEKCKAANRAYYRKYPEKYKSTQRTCALRTYYGMSISDYDTMLKKQNGKCAICRRKNLSRRYRHFHIDHDHKTKRVRGLLCHTCNLSLGIFSDSVKILNTAIKYLKGELAWQI